MFWNSLSPQKWHQNVVKWKSLGAGICGIAINAPNLCNSNQVYHKLIYKLYENRDQTLKSKHMIIIFGIQTKSNNSDHFVANGLNSDRLRKIRPEWQQWHYKDYFLKIEIFWLCMFLAPYMWGIQKQGGLSWAKLSLVGAMG